MEFRDQKDAYTWIFPFTITKIPPKFPMYNYLTAKLNQINLLLAKNWSEEKDQDINKLSFSCYL